MCAFDFVYLASTLRYGIEFIQYKMIEIEKLPVLRVVNVLISHGYCWGGVCVRFYLYFQITANLHISFCIVVLK